MDTALLKGLVLGLMLSISVGPVIFSILKQSINHGHKGGFAFIAGVSASDAAIVIAANFFTQFFSELLTYKTEIGIGGSCLLIVLGVYVTFFKKVQVNQEGVHVITTMRKREYLKIFLSGFFMNLLNPAVIGFWLITSTSLLIESYNYRLIVFSTCLIIVAVLDVAKVMLAGRIRQKLTLHNIHLINRISGLILVGFGLALIWGILSFGDRLS